jgi:voltage-gated potassium channel
LGEPDHPRSRRAVIWDLLMSVLALASLVPVLWVELAELHWPHPRFKWLAAIDLVFVAIFAAEFLYGLRRTDDRVGYLKRRWFEVPGLVPLYLEAFALLRVAQLFRLLRLLRVLRTIKALRRTRVFKLLDLLLNRHKLLHTALITAVVVVTLAAAVWWIERDTNDGLSRFSDALWWAIVTTTTVGYGDITPQTGLGRLVATGLMLMGIGLIAVLASSFSAALITTDADQHTSGDGLVDGLERLAHLHEQGHLSDEEFSAAKRKLLAPGKPA